MWTERHSNPTLVKRDSHTPESDLGEYHRDRARIIHSSSFRSLQSKTQVLGLGENDFYRTRLTHSLEVAQIGSGICEILKRRTMTDLNTKKWLPGFPLIEAICLAHDLGHPPFGHGGEVSANYIMRNHGGFEGNGQTLRILTTLGEYSDNDGLDLTRRTLLGTIKYPAFYKDVINNKILPNDSIHSSSNITAWTPPKCIYNEESEILDWILIPFSNSDKYFYKKIHQHPNKHAKTLYKAFDTTIMELADDIAYGVHDLEDAIALKFIDRHQWLSHVNNKLASLPANPIGKEIDFYTENLFSGSNKSRKHAISKLVSYFMNAINIEIDSIFEHPLLQLQAIMEPTAFSLLTFLKELVMTEVILLPELQALQFKGQRIIIKLFTAYIENPQQLLPKDILDQFEQQGQQYRVICDHIASMSDISASRNYAKLFSPSTGSIFDRV